MRTVPFAILAGFAVQPAAAQEMRVQFFPEIGVEAVSHVRRQHRARDFSAAFTWKLASSVISMKPSS